MKLSTAIQVVLEDLREYDPRRYDHLDDAAAMREFLDQGYTADHVLEAERGRAISSTTADAWRTVLAVSGQVIESVILGSQQRADDVDAWLEREAAGVDVLAPARLVVRFALTATAVFALAGCVTPTPAPAVQITPAVQIPVPASAADTAGSREQCVAALNDGNARLCLVTSGDGADIVYWADKFGGITPAYLDPADKIATYDRCYSDLVGGGSTRCQVSGGPHDGQVFELASDGIAPVVAP